MKFLLHRSIQQKITLVILLVSSVVLLLACVALFWFQSWSIKRSFTGQLTVTGQIAAKNVAVAAMFKDEERAAQTLAGLNAMPEIVSASLILEDGTQLAFVGNETGGISRAGFGLAQGIRVEGSRVLLAQPVERDGQRHGTLYLHADFRSMYTGLLALYGGILSIVLGVSLLLAFLLSSRLQGFVTGPILRLARTARKIAEGRDYTVRAEESAGAEVGVLTEAFNRMLAEIQAQDAALKGAQGELRDQLKSLEREMAERMAVEEELRLAEQKFRGLVEQLPGITYHAALGETCKWTYVSPQIHGLLGFTPEEWLASDHLWFDHVHPDDRGIPIEAEEVALHTGNFLAEYRMITRSGESRWFRDQAVVVPAEGSGQPTLNGVMLDVTEAKVAETRLADLNKQFVETSRMAGMAEVATGVLHNVGNVLNSVNVSASLVLEKLRNSKAPKLGKASELLLGRNGDLADYLTHDPSGQKLPGYLAKLGQYLVAENTQLMTEVEQLSRNIEHIKEIVAMQQNYAKVSGVFENLPADRLVEDAIAMNIGAFERHGVTLDRRFHDVPSVRVDRHRVMQILINLIRNAKYALDDVERTDKRITVTITQVSAESVAISIGDNGIGISPENLTRIFGHGFTTRKDGHGFGLHSGALAAKEMGGTLAASSSGVGLGATFTLELPVASNLSRV